MTSRWHVTFLPVTLVLFLVWQCVFAVHAMMADALNFSVQREMVFWGIAGKIPAAAEIAAARERMESALALWPHHPDYLSLLARIHAWQGQISANKPEADKAFKLAITTMHQSLVERPGNPFSWAQYAEYLSTQRDKRLELLLAVDKVRTLGAGEAGLQKRMQALVIR